MYLLWFIFLCISITFIFHVFWGMDFEDSLIVSQLSLIVILFICYVFNILRIGITIVQVLFLIGLSAGIMISWKQKTMISSFRSIFKTPCMAYVLFLCIVYFLVRDNVPSRGDELCYWASLPKVLFQYSGDLQLNNGFQTYCVDYIPAMPLYTYFLEEVNGTFHDGLLFFGYSALAGALILPAGKKLHGWRGVAGILTALLVTPPVFYNTITNDGAVFYQSLYIDPIMGVAVGCLIWLFLNAPWRDKIHWIQFILYASFIILLKSSGIAFVLVSTITLLIYLLLFEKPYLKHFKIWLGIFFPLLLYGMWHIANSYFGIQDTVPYHLSAILDFSFLKTFIRVLLKESVFTSYIPYVSKYCTFGAIIIFLSVVLILFMALQSNVGIKSRENSSLIKCSYLMLGIQTVVYVIGLYILCVGPWGGQLLSYRRYICTILEAILCFIVCNFLYNFTILWNAIKTKKYRMIIGCILAMLSIVILPLKRSTYDVYPQYIHDDSDAVCKMLQQNNLSSDHAWSRLVILIDEEEKYVSWIKSFYGHFKNNLAYNLISSDIQVNHRIYYTSEMNIDPNMQTVVCTLTGNDEWISADYILWCHGHYVESPILNWELYKVDHIDKKELRMIFLEAGERK